MDNNVLEYFMARVISLEKENLILKEKLENKKAAQQADVTSEVHTNFHDTNDQIS